MADLVTRGLCHGSNVVVITSPAKFEPRSGWIYLAISDSKHSYTLPWAMPPHYNYTGIVSLETNHLYTFTVAEEELAGIPKDISLTNVLIPRVVRVEDQGKLVWDREVCEVHNCKMSLQEVPIHYGLPVPEPNGPAPGQEARHFPHGREFLWGGCVVRPQSPRSKRIYICPDCKEALAWWSGSAKAPTPVLPRVTRYDNNPGLRAIYLDSFGKGYVDAWARNEVLPVSGPTSEEDKAQVLGYCDGMVEGRTAREAWSASNSQRYGAVK